MSSIRRQSIIASLVIYLGFVVGMLNTYFFGSDKYFTGEQYGLTTIFVAIAQMMAALANFAMPSVIAKFYPYYKDHLPDRKNDMISIALMVGVAGFALVCLGGWIFRDLVVQKYSENAKDLVYYYFWTFPFGLGFTIFTILEVYACNVGRPVLTNFLKEVQWRLIVTVLIVLFIFSIIPDFSLFIKLYALAYPAIALTLLGYLIFTKRIHFTLQISKVTRRLYRKMLSFSFFLYSSFIVFTLAQVFDQLLIASVLDEGIKKAGIFGLAQLMSNVILAPKRGIVAASIPVLSRAWKEKDYNKLQRIYQRSSINQLLFSGGLFLLITLNYTEAIHTFQLKEELLLGFTAFIVLGLTRVIEMGTGLNAEIIGTSAYYKFELISGLVLLSVMLPLSYILAKQFDILGPAIANLIAIGLYNLVRLIFLWKKFGFMPFNQKTMYALLLGAACYGISWFLFREAAGIWGIVGRTALFGMLYVPGIIFFKITPDSQPVLETIRKRLSKLTGSGRQSQR